jgi:glucosamine-6-phosphate deaminase
MQPSTVVFDDLDSLGQHLAQELADGIVQARAEGRPFVLGCPGGRSPRTTYQQLARVVAQREMAIDHLVIAMMDDYVVTDAAGGRALPEPTAHFSCRGLAYREIFEPLNAAASDDGIRPENLWFPRLEEPEAYDAQLAEVGVDVFLLASGASDGHVAFNPAGTLRSSRTRVVELAETTRRDNLGTFPEFRSLDDVPRLGLSVGIATIADNARRLVMILDGPHKRTAFEHISRAERYGPAWPATVVSAVFDNQLLAVREAVPADYALVGPTHGQDLCA